MFDAQGEGQNRSDMATRDVRPSTEVEATTSPSAGGASSTPKAVHEPTVMLHPEAAAEGCSLAGGEWHDSILQAKEERVLEASSSARHGPAVLTPSSQSVRGPPITKPMAQHNVGHSALEQEQSSSSILSCRSGDQQQTTANNLFSLGPPTEVYGLSTLPPPRMPNVMLVQGIDPHEVPPPPPGRPEWRMSQQAHDEQPAIFFENR